jgi:ComF family protein
VARASEGDWKSFIADVARAAGDLLLPVCCAACETLMPPGDRGIVCGHCWSRVRMLPHPQCERCGHPTGRHTCQWCDLLPPFVRAARSYCWMGVGTGEKIVHALKYDGWRRVAHGMAERMARVSWVADVVEERAVVIPVPLSTTRLRERGYNQSAEIARSLAPLWKSSVWEGVLLRTASTTSQTQLTPGERKSNVAGAFAVPDSARARLRGAHVVMVDDVITTGSTLHACASALFAAGARTISYMTFGRAPASGDRLHPQDRTKWQ